MNVCLYGAGAVGGHIAARLIASGAADVSVIARGAQLSAIRERGLTVRRGAGEVMPLTVRPVTQTDDVEALPPQDLVIVTLKAPALPAAAAAIDQLLAPGGVALFVTNGIPWWWNHGLPTKAAPLPLLDPDGTLWELLRERTLGCVCYGSAEVVSPGVIQATANDRWIIGDPTAATAATSPRLRKVIDLFERARFDVRPSDDLRRDVWIKLLVNASLNTVSSLTRLPSVRVCADADLNTLMIRLMQETVAVAAACGWPLQDDLDLNKLASPGDRPPEHRTSMLQDVLGARPLETEAVLGQVAVFARAAHVPTPALDILLILLRGLDRSSRP
jgi:2-dehydropantoate 2-reductase